MISGRTIRRIDHTVLDRQPVFRKLFDHGNIQIPVQDDRQRPRDRCRAHNKDMRIKPFCRQHFPLPHTEPMLFIGHNKGKIFIFHFFLDQRMRSDDKICFPRRDPGISLSFFLCGHRSGQQFRSQGNPIFQKHMRDIFIMLPSQHFCRSHQRRLKSVQSCIKHGEQCDDRLSRSYVSLHQPGHHMHTGHILPDFPPDFFLPVCQFKRKP